MRKITLTLTAVALALGAMASQASAQNQQRAASSVLALKNATPIVKLANCDGTTGYCSCGPGFVSACAPRCFFFDGRYRRPCSCVRCYTGR